MKEFLNRIVRWIVVKDNMPISGGIMKEFLNRIVRKDSMRYIWRYHEGIPKKNSYNG